ncbi:hypothetical protein SprV_0401652100 [Sparganum proliferum]
MKLIISVVLLLAVVYAAVSGAPAGEQPSGGLTSEVKEERSASKKLLDLLKEFGNKLSERLKSALKDKTGDIVAALLGVTVFVSTLDEPEIYAIAAAVSGLGKTVAKIIKERSKWANSIFDYLRDEVAKLVNVLLKRWLDNEGTVYTIMSKLLTAIQPAL